MSSTSRLRERGRANIPQVSPVLKHLGTTPLLQLEVFSHAPGAEQLTFTDDIGNVH